MRTPLWPGTRLRVSALLGLSAVAAGQSWNFDKDTPGRIAAGWTNASGTWEVVADPTAPSKPYVLAQVSSNHSGSYFNVAVANEPSVWRYRDLKNYYIARQNNLEDNYRVYKVVDGRRIQLGSADITAKIGTWHEVTVAMVGDHIQCFFDAKKYLAVTDDTFKDAGKEGLWTKADAQTHFDDFRVLAAPVKHQAKSARSRRVTGR